MKDCRFKVRQIIPADGWFHEDRGAHKFVKPGAKGYSYTHERLIGWALVDVVGLASGESWEAIVGIVKYAEDDPFVDASECKHQSELPDCADLTQEVVMGCQHWQALAHPAPPSEEIITITRIQEPRTH